MALRRAHADEYAVRVNRAVEWLVERSPADAMRGLQAEYGLSERRARRYVNEALARLCGLPASDLMRRVSRREERVGEQIRRWAEAKLRDELAVARRECALHVSPDPMERELFDSWFHSDRQLADGHTPAQRYAERPDLNDDERIAAARIAAARLGIHRVIDVALGQWIELEDIVDGARHRVLSESVSRAVVRRDLVIGRVMDGEPGALWGATRVLEPDDEPLLLDELAGMEGQEALSGPELRRAIAAHPLELLRFRPRRVTPRFFTIEGARDREGRLR